MGRKKKSVDTVMPVSNSPELMKSNESVTNAAIEMLKAGDKPSFVKERLLEKYHDLFSEAEITDLIFDAVRILTSNFSTALPEVQSQHIQRYQSKISELLATEEIDESQVGLISKGLHSKKAFQASRKNKIARYTECLQCLQQLELACGIYNSNISIEINSDFPKNEPPVENSKSKHDVSKLSLDQLARFIELTDKCEVINHSEPKSVILNVREEPKDLLEFETIPEPEPNINKIQIEPHIQNESSPVGKSSAEVRKAMLEKIKFLSAKRLQQSGVNLSAEEKNLLNNE